jgi:hypothetical protein
MPLLRSFTLVLASVLLVPALSGAAPPPEPKVEYSADSTIETEDGLTMKSHIYHAPGKERIEVGGPGGNVTIIRRDKNVMWQLMGNMYVEMPLHRPDVHDPQEMDVQQTAVGEETVNGVRTTKYKVSATEKDGSKFGGFFWTTKDGIMVKMDLLSKEGNEKVRIHQELTNLKIGKQDPKLFEIPPGYTKNDLGAMMGGRGKGKGGRPAGLEEMMKAMGKGREMDEEAMEAMMKKAMGR